MTFVLAPREKTGFVDVGKLIDTMNHATNGFTVPDLIELRLNFENSTRIRDETLQHFAQRLPARLQ